MTVRRVRLRSVARVGCSLGWLISLLPALLVSALAVWVLHGIWSTLHGWTPWTPWAPGQRIGGIPLPAPPEFRPREALHVEDIYRLLEPVGQHPFVATALGTLALTLLGGALLALVFLLAGAGYNAFARFTGGIEFELAPRSDGPDGSGWRDDSELVW